MSPRALADTSALMALFNPDDQNHALATAIARRFLSGNRLVGTTLMLGELHGLLLRRSGIKLARRVAEVLLDDPAYEWVEVSTSLIRDAVTRWLQKFDDQRFSLTDAVSLEVMRREGIAAAFAFDRHFVTAGFELLR